MTNNRISHAAIDRVLEAAVDRGDVPGVAALVASHAGPLYAGAAGLRDVSAAAPMTVDTPLRLSSMTKAITSVAALQLVERGELQLDAPVDRYRPEFADVFVLEGFAGTSPRLRRPRTRATVRQLLSHTAGLAYWVWNRDIDRFEQLTGTPNVLSGRVDAFAAPLVRDPGTGFEYGIATDWLGRVIEAVSGQPLDIHIAAHVTGPLGMHDTTASMGAAQRAVSAPVHVRDADGAWAATDIDWAPEPEFAPGGHFLYSTPRDFLRFARMLLGGGALDGTRILRRATVDLAFTDQLGALRLPSVMPTVHPQLSADVELGADRRWGLGLLLAGARRPGMRRGGSGGWSGLCNTHFWVDPSAGLAAAIFAQTLPFRDPGADRVAAEFERAVYGSPRVPSRPAATSVVR